MEKSITTLPLPSGTETKEAKSKSKYTPAHEGAIVVTAFVCSSCKCCTPLSFPPQMRVGDKLVTICSCGQKQSWKIR